MFIYHFHRIIRHRLVWGAFAIIVSLAFLSVDSCYQSNSTAGSVAQIDGKPISSEFFAILEREVRGLGRSRTDTTPFPEIATQVWQQVAAFQVADELKLRVSPEEIRSAVQESIGATEGYDSVVHANYLARLRENGLQASQYEQYLRHMLTLRKVGSILDAAVWVTPLEVDDELSGLTDEVAVRLINVNNSFTHATATPAQIQAFFDVHSNAFQLPRQVAVQYVAMPISNYLASVSVTDQQISEYYDDHGDKLVSSNAAATITREEAKPQIIAILQQQIARQAAYTNLANTFLAIATQANTNGFATAAATFELPIRQTPFFATGETPDNIDAGKEFALAAFDLDPAQPDGRYNVLAGSNFVYAITLLANSPAHMPTLTEVLDRVRPLAVNKVRKDLFREHLESLHKQLSVGLQKKQDLDALAKTKALNVSTTITYTVHTLYMNPFTNHMPVARAALHLRPGELSEATMADNEEDALFVYMEDRKPGDNLSAETLRPKARANIERARAMGLNTSWMGWNLARKSLVLTPGMLSQLTAAPTSKRAED